MTSLRPILILAFSALIAASLSAQDTVRITVDHAITHQTIEGFGATTESLIYGTSDNLTPALRQQAIRAAYGEVRLSTGNVTLGTSETPANTSDTWGQRANDDNDPMHINAAGFNWVACDAMKANVLDLAQSLGFTDFYPANQINIRWEMPWLDTLRKTDYRRFLDECGEHVLAGLLHWRDAYGITPRLMMLFNEPITGNGELFGGTPQQVVDIIVHVGQRLRAAGFDSITFVVPGEESEESSLSLATTIMADSAARSFVGALAYHTYPYGSVYSAVPNILATSGIGKPDSTRIAVRGRLRDLAERYGVQLWMTEVSHGGVDPRSFDALRGRAIHIHDEFTYANASAWFGMMNMWDTKAQQGHFGNKNLYSDEGTLILVDDDSAKVVITGTGYAVGHYARWIARGDRRIEATTNDPLLQVSAYRNWRQARDVMVVINSHSSAVTIDTRFSNAAIAGTIVGEQSTAALPWQGVTCAAVDSHRIVTTVPGMSVTTFAVSLATVSGVAQPSPVPGAILLGPNFPEPFSAATTFSARTTAAGRTSIGVYDMLGRQVRELYSGDLSAGDHQFWFNASALPAGVYTCILRSANAVASRLVHRIER